MISFYKNESGVVMYRDDSYLDAEKFTVERPATAFDLTAHPTEYAAFTAVGQTLTAAYPSGTIGTIQFTRTLVALPFTKTLISGAVANAVSSLTYQITSADSGYNVGVDFSNQVSSSTPTKAQISTAPVINGTPTVGTALSITAGTFTGGNPTPTITRIIYSNGTSVSSSGSYTPVSADVGATFVVTEVATNSAGTVTNPSATSAACIAAQTTAVAPSAPTVLATKGPASATLVITPGTAGSTATTGYTVTLPTNAVDADNGSTKLTRTITGLTPFTSQTFSVVANSASGNSSAGVSNSVAADRVDTTAPTFVAGTITGSTVRLTYVEALTSGSIDASQFTLALNGAAAVAPSALSQFGSLLVLTFPSTAAIGDTATISYTQGAAATAVRDAAPTPNLAANLSAQSITNNTAAATTNVFGANRIRANDSYVTGSSGIATHHYKFEAEADFIGIRIGYVEHNTSGTMPNLEFLYGVTDTGAYDTVMHEYVPTSNGVSKNTMAASASEVAWHRGTWNGGNNIGVPSPSAQASYAGNVTWSDLMPCASIPRTDVVGGRPMLVLRVANTLSGAVWTQGPANANYNNGRGQPFYREMLTYKTSNDAVNNPGNLPSGTNNNFQNEMAIFVEFQYANPIRNVILTGDSRNSSAFNSYITSWQLVALRQAIGATGKIGVVNCTGSGHNQVQFLKLVNDFLDSGGHATDLIIPAFSQNGYTNAATYASNMQATLDRCTAAGINIWMDTDYSVDGYTTQEPQRQTSLSNARTLLAQGKIKGLIDIDSLVTDYGPQYPIFKAGLTLDGTSFPGDKIHVSSAAQNSLLQPMLTKVWQ